MSQEKLKNQEEQGDPVIVQEKITKKNGEVIIKQYLRGKVLGKGGFATCYEMTELDKNKLSAAKIVAKASLTKKRALEKLLAEIKIHKSLHHENIVQFEHVFEDKENVYILLELCPNQSLKELLKKHKRFTEPECAFYMVQTINALKYLHAKKIIHRDLKLGNILIGKDFEIKLADFGLAARIENDGERRRTICGTPNYIAPEVLDKKIGHSYEVDIWSMGVICYTLLVGRPPFETNDTKQTYRKILKASYAFPSNVHLSENAKDLIKKILVLEPSKRPVLEEILEHPFIKSQENKPFAIQTFDANSSVKKVLSLHSTTSPKNPFVGLSTDKAFINTVMTPTQLNSKGFPVDKEIDEQDVYAQTLGKDLNKLGLHQKIKSDEVKHENLAATSPKTFVNNKEEIDIKLKPDYETSVAKWVDYSSKYGLGYLLTDGTAGLVFKDMSRITLSPDGLKFEYMKKKPDENKEVLFTYNIDEYPKDLEKKVVLLNYFKSYLEGTITDEAEEKVKNKGDHKGRESIKPMPLVYVKKWMKTKYAVMFRLSNRMVQVDFTDKTQIVLSPINQIVCYKNKKGEQSQHPLTTALDSDFPEMVKRLKYTKEILAYIKGINQNKEDGAEENYMAQTGKVGAEADEPKVERVY